MIDGKTLVIPGEGEFVIRANGGKPVRFICLSREHSLDFYRVTVKGQDYAVIAPANVFARADEIVFETIDNPSYTAAIYPSLTDVENAIGLRGAMQLLRFEQTMPVCELTVEQRYDNRALVHFDSSVIQRLSELYLNVDYLGDIGWAFINGRLVHDNFYNGQTWVIALKRLADKLGKGDLYLYLSEPVSADNAVTVHSESTYAKVSQNTTGKAHFDRIWLSMQQEQTIRP